uniref:Chemokine interleukin-8-like domain-containing protein n=1 Tax=Denticeps clupeoides TaxID=299321 RepID=A0AAY4A1F1_9TELE
MKFYALLFLVLLTCLYLTTAQGSYEDCCLKYVKTVKPAIKRRVTQYRLQELDGGCNIPAVVFTLKYGRVMCADPKQPWVKSLVHNLDRKMVIDGFFPSRTLFHTLFSRGFKHPCSL